MSSIAQSLRPTASLHGKVAIVTGAGALSGGIGNGRAAAILLAEDGCNVVCVDLQPALAQETVDMIRKDQKGKAIAVVADVTQAADCERVVKTALSEYGRLDILVNNVGVKGPAGSAVQVDMADFMKGLEINVGSMVQMVKYAVPAMIPNPGQCAGSIINISSVAGLLGGIPNLLYPTSKGAVVNMTRAMAANHASDRIRVNCVCPGTVYTPMVYGSGPGMTDEVRRARAEKTLLGTEGTGWDVGSAVRFFSSDLCRWVTGVVFPVDGGLSAATPTQGLRMPLLAEKRA
ncbi:putative tropinone reductase [Aspergillus spinulosporus]